MNTMKYYGTYSCGHEGCVNIIGPGKDREWKKEQEFSGLCPDCYKKHAEESRKLQNEQAAERSKEMDLPELVGSPKQVAWANTLRIKFVDWLSKYVNNYYEDKSKKVLIKNNDGKHMLFTLDEIAKLEQFIYTEKADAKFWIDSRYTDKRDLLFDLASKWKDRVPEEVEAEIKEEELKLTVVPDNKTVSGIVSLYVEDEYIKAKYIKDDIFREIVKSLGYSWEGVWCKKITEYSGPEKDRIAELGNKLLANGFTVHFPGAESRDMAISGNFMQECTKWVKYNTEKNMLSLIWKGRSDDIYEKARKISGSRWHHGYMLVPIEFYQEVLDFADVMGFKLSKRAEKEINAFEDSSTHFLKKDVKEPVYEEKNGSEELKKKLKKSGIIEDLRDEA